MKVQIWANLGVQNVERTKAFYTQLGIQKNAGHESDELASFIFGDEGFVMYPNPANESLNIEVAMTADQPVQVNVMDAAGRVAVQQNRSLSKGDNVMQLDLSRLANGIYFVQVRNGEQATTRRLVVQH